MLTNRGFVQQTKYFTDTHYKSNIKDILYLLTSITNPLIKTKKMENWLN